MQSGEIQRHTLQHCNRPGGVVPTRTAYAPATARRYHEPMHVCDGLGMEKTLRPESKCSSYRSPPPKKTHDMQVAPHGIRQPN